MPLFFRLTFSVWLVSLLLSGCQQIPRFQDVREVVPTITFQEFSLNELNPDRVLGEQELVVGLKFAFHNPFRRPLPIPQHNFAFKLNDEVLPLALSSGQGGIDPNGSMPGFSIPPQETVYKTYPVALSLNPDGALQAFSVFGKENALAFETVFTLELTEFADEMFDFESLLENEEQQEAYRLLKELLRQKLGRKTYTLTHELRLKIPTVPQIGFSAQQPLEFRFLGQMESLNIGPIRDAMNPMIDLLVQAADMGVNTPLPTDPFLNLLDQELSPEDVPPPLNVLYPANRTSVSQEEFLLKHVAGVIPGLGQFYPYWQSFRGRYVPPAGTSLLTHSIQTFVDPQADAGASWTSFKNQWQNFQDEERFPDEIRYPGLRVTGVEVVIPFTLKNTNEFPISAPATLSRARLNQHTPLAFSAGPVGSTVQIAAGASQPMEIAMQLSWGALQNGFQDVLNGASLQPDLQGSFNLDLGYGPVKVEMDLQDVLMQWQN